MTKKELFDEWERATNARESAARRLEDLNTAGVEALKTLEARKQEEQHARCVFMKSCGFVDHEPQPKVPVSAGDRKAT